MNNYLMGLFLCFLSLFLATHPYALSYESKKQIPVLDLKRGDYISSSITHKSTDPKTAENISVKICGAVLYRKPAPKRAYNMATKELIEAPSDNKDSQGEIIPNGELWYEVTILTDAIEEHNKRTFDLRKKTGVLKYRRFLKQGKEMVMLYKPSSVFEAYAEKEMQNPDSNVEDYFQNPKN